jgi:hypothetical protein
MLLGTTTRACPCRPTAASHTGARRSSRHSCAAIPTHRAEAVLPPHRLFLARLCCCAELTVSPRGCCCAAAGWEDIAPPQDGRAPHHCRTEETGGGAGHGEHYWRGGGHDLRGGQEESGTVMTCGEDGRSQRRE